MFDVIGDDVMDFYFGGGVGYSIGHNKGPFDDILGLKSFNGIADDWFASGIVGLKFFTGDLFSIGAEAHYRYYMTSGAHYFSGDLVLGFTI